MSALNEKPVHLSLEKIDLIVAACSEIILGKEDQIRLAITCMMARGHLLIEDLPGVGKTTLSHTLAKVLGLQFQRIQFTSDLLPSDISGVSVFDRDSGSFQFHPGPIFSQFILADEINRATPKTQSALLEAMEEKQVTTEGTTRKLPEPFFVIATQNPSHQIGTFPLPESQLDRFLMRIALGAPDKNAERELLKGDDRRELIKHLKPVVTAEELLGLQDMVKQIHTSDALLDYLQALLEESRQSALFVHGLSPRAGLSCLHSAQAWALLNGRDFVDPKDLQTILPATIGHRIQASDDYTGYSSDDLIKLFIESVAIP